eukprot:CAMPEP_0184695524 /NCGR_PEP_ID=MMETSP0313-20130426/3128_1 /TAXON_ID=2792 /ORGANISM="Porphyridium aerugineum, Strain SAG 1380-2" /LENGTH=354 /DNA_ID=CAMNT_0027154003 /DNA_START=51 /DNA_END=1115 /DNA_ORIENTATION=+
MLFVPSIPCAGLVRPVIPHNKNSLCRNYLTLNPRSNYRVLCMAASKSPKSDNKGFGSENTGKNKNPSTPPSSPSSPSSSSKSKANNSSSASSNPAPSAKKDKESTQSKPTNNDLPSTVSIPFKVVTPSQGSKNFQISPSESMLDNFNDDDEEDEVIILDVVSQRELPCIISRTIEVDKVNYSVLYPRDEPVVIATLTAEVGGYESVLTAVEEEEKMNELFPIAYQVMAEENVALIRSAYVMTVSGLDEEEEDDGDDSGFENYDVDDDNLTKHLDRESDEPEQEDEDVEVLGQFYYKGVEYMVCKPLDPVFFVARPFETPEGKERKLYYVPDKKELDRVFPRVESQLANDLEFGA